MKILLLVFTLAVAIGLGAGLYLTPEQVIAKTSKDTYCPPNIEANGGQNGCQAADNGSYFVRVAGGKVTKGVIKEYIDYHRQKEKLLQQL